MTEGSVCSQTTLSKLEDTLLYVCSVTARIPQITSRTWCTVYEGAPACGLLLRNLTSGILLAFFFCICNTFSRIILQILKSRLRILGNPKRTWSSGDRSVLLLQYKHESQGVRLGDICHKQHQATRSHQSYGYYAT